MTRKLLVLFAFAFVVQSSAAFAQWGRTPVWLAGTVIAVDGSYVVTRDIASPAPSVITIVTPNVDLDLNGFTLTGAPGGMPVISIPGPFSEIRIHNGRLSGGAMSIDASGSGRKLIIEKVHSQDAAGPGAAALHATDIQDVVIRDCTVVGATTPNSIAIDGAAVVGKTGTIERNVIESTASGGIQVLLAQSLAILHNRIDVPGPGIELNGNGCLVSENTVRSSAADGILFRQGKGNKFFDNVVAGCGANGLNVLPGAGDSLVLNNVLTNNGGHGLWVQGARNLVERNTMNGNTGCGMFLQGATNTFGRNMARGNLGAACGPCPGGLFPPESCSGAPTNNSFGDNLIPGPPTF